MHDERQLKPAQHVEAAFHTFGGETNGFAGTCQTFQSGALRRDVRKLAQLAQRHADAVVLADHCQARGAAVHLFGLLDPAEASDDILTELRFGTEIYQEPRCASFGDLLLPLQLPVDDPNAIFQDLTHLWIALENQLHGLL
jgi:hypothetical protein